MVASKLPWNYCGESKKNPPCECGYIFGDGGQIYVAKALNKNDKVDPVAYGAISAANAELIVTAVNSHAEMKAALELLLEAKHVKDKFGKGPAYEQLKARGWAAAEVALEKLKLFQLPWSG